MLVVLALAAAVGAVGVQLRGEAPLYGGVGERVPSVSVLEGLPAFSPSTMPTRYYDSTEYDVAPFVTPFSLPTPPPPPSLVETSAATRLMGQAGSAQSIQAAAANAAAAAAAAASQRGLQQQQQQQQVAAPALPRTPLMRYRQQMMQQMQQMQMQQMQQRTQAQAQAQAPVSLLQEASALHHVQRQHNAAKHRVKHHAKHHAKAKAQAKAYAKHHAKHGHGHSHSHSHGHRAQHHASASATAHAEAQAQAQQAMRQRAFEESASRMRFSRRSVEAPEPVLMETTSTTLSRGKALHRSRQELEVANAALQQQLNAMQANAVAWQRQREAQAAYLAAPHEAERAAALAARPMQPVMAEAPESIAARGYVPHFAPLVRALPSQQPFQPYAGFFEANAQAHSSAAAAGPSAYAGRPQEPFLPRLPPPPIALGEY